MPAVARRSAQRRLALDNISTRTCLVCGTGARVTLCAARNGRVRVVTDRIRFSVELPPDPTELRRLRIDLTRWLGEAGIDGAARDAVLLATHEAVASAMGSPGDVVVDAACSADAVTVAVTSEDGWTSPDDDLGGRRMGIVRNLVNEVSFDKPAGRPQLRFTKPLS